MKTTIVAKCFPGFYGTVFDEGYVEEDGRRDLLGEHDLQHIDDWGVSEDYRQKVAEEVSRAYIDRLNTELGLRMTLVSVTLSSPREYNFTNDQVICEVEVGDYDRFIKKITDMMDDPQYRTDLAGIIWENHSDRPGFWSWMSNQIEDWYVALLNPDNTNYLECVLWYLYCLKTGERDGDDWTMADGIYEAIRCNTDIMRLVPSTIEAEIEYDECKERELVMEGLRNWPVIPGLFD